MLGQVRSGYVMLRQVSSDNDRLGHLISVYFSIGLFMTGYFRFCQVISG